MQLAKLGGGIVSSPGLKVSEWAETYMTELVKPTKAEATYRVYRHVLDAYLLPALGDRKLRSVDYADCDQLVMTMQSQGVGAATIHKTITVLSGMYRYAMKRRRASMNPVRGVEKPSARRARIVEPLVPKQVEAIRGFVGSGRLGRRDATLISVLAYAGLRPQEALGLQFRDVRTQVLLVQRAIAFGKQKDVKTGEPRAVTLFPTLADDLVDYSSGFVSRRPSDWLFPGSDGGPWAEWEYRNWRRRVFKPAAAHFGLDTTPYDLRHSWTSLLLRSRKWDPAAISREAGHSPQTFFRVYAHEIKNLRDMQVDDPDTVIREARRDVRENPPKAGAFDQENAADALLY